jgi:hypothetical protein
MSRRSCERWRSALGDAPGRIDMNKKGLTMAVVALIGMLGFGAVSEAGTINRRERRQRARIADGARSGELTRREARRLRAGERHIQREERRYRRSDGQLSRWERRDLQRDLNRQSRRIQRQKHDEQDR